jgi:mannose-6-phosphate isomerase-like protein (cupin superfamily)
MPFRFVHSAANSLSTINIPALGLELAVRLPPDASGGTLTVIETINAAGFGPPLHRHSETEVFHVLEGRYLFEVDGRRFEAGTGDMISVPGGAAHTFVNITDQPARQLVMMLPGMDAQKFFIGLGETFAAGKPDRQALNSFGKPWGVEFLGPPLSRKTNVDQQE